MKKLFITAFLLMVIVLPIGYTPSTNAAEVTGDGGSTVTGGKTTSQEQQINAEFQNPLQVKTISELFYKILNFVVGLSYVVIAAFYLLAGFKFVKAQGNPEELSSAKRAFLNTTIGAIIIIGINVITQVIESIINSLKKS